METNTTVAQKKPQAQPKSKAKPKADPLSLEPSPSFVEVKGSRYEIWDGDNTGWTRVTSKKRKNNK
jgi:hypothetical protein